MNRAKKTSAFDSQGRHLQSNEFADLRGINAVPVSFRAAALLTAAKRDFIWWLQGLSLKEGGLHRVARELLEMFPERLGTKEMHAAKVVPDKIYPGEFVSKLKFALGLGDYMLLDNSDEPPCNGADMIQLCRSRALSRERTHGSDTGIKSTWPWAEARRDFSIAEYLVELCINPKIKFSLPGEDSAGDELEFELACEADPSLSKYDFKPAELVYFRDIIGALVEYRASREKSTLENFYVTAIGREIWDKLDFALRTRSMVVIYGREGRGKTEAVKAYAELHGGQVRFATLNGVATKTAMFRAIAAALGITAAYNLNSVELQSRIEDVLKRSKLMLLIDEAHFLFNQSQRTKARPELIDWLDTAISNCKIPAALCTTPQFMDCMARAAYQVQWNYNQFRRRTKWTALPEENTEEDIAGVAGKVFAGANAAVLKKVVSYVFSSGRDLSALGDVARELADLLGTTDFSKATFKQVDQIIRENLYTSDNAFLTQMEQARQRLPKGRKQPVPALPAHPDEASEEQDEPIRANQPAIVAAVSSPSLARSRSAKVADEPDQVGDRNRLSAGNAVLTVH